VALCSKRDPWAHGQVYTQPVRSKGGEVQEMQEVSHPASGGAAGIDEV
jgi:hypothetical protein